MALPKLFNSINNKLSLSGGTMTGEIKIGQGDGRGIQLGEIGRINANNSSGDTNCTILGLNSTSSAILGHPDFSINMRGSGLTYNGKSFAFKDELNFLPLSGGTLTGNLAILTGDTDKYLTWDYSQSSSQMGGSWRIGMQGTGSGNTNYFVFQTTTSNLGSSETWTNVLYMGQNDRDIWVNGSMNNVVNTDYSKVKFRGTSAGTGSAPSSLNNGEVYMKY